MLSSAALRRLLALVPLLFIAFVVALSTRPILAADPPSPFIEESLANRITDKRTADESAVLVRLQDESRVIPGQYIVVYRQTRALTTAQSEQLVNDLGGQLLFTYDAVLNGFAASNLTDDAIAKLQANDAVAYIEPDQIVSLQDEPSLGGTRVFLPVVSRSSGTTGGGQTQPNATWGLDRVDQRSLPLNGTYTYNQSGQNVHAYVIDTGIRATHSEFTGRVGNGYDAVDGGAPDDCQGHGSHVAGTVGGTLYGVAKNVTIHAVRVLNCEGSGSNAGVIGGMNWVAQNRQLPAVANMSLGGPASAAVDNAVNGLIGANVTVVVAAGNENQNACNVSPSRTPGAITVGATDNQDTRAYFSNYGACLDLFAPGVEITSAWYNSNDATNTIDGTSMASPHVAGFAALVLSANPSFTPSQVANFITSNATPNLVSDPAGSANLLLFSPYGNPGAPNPNPTPTPPPTGGHSATYTGSITEGQLLIGPTGGFQVTQAGMITGQLSGPGGTDFDLFLYEVIGGQRIEVDSSYGTTSSELIEYNAGPGTYIWGIGAYSGSGNFSLATTWP